MSNYLNGSISIAIAMLSFLLITPSYSQTEIDSLKQLEFKEIAEQIVSSALKERKGYEALKNQSHEILKEIWNSPRESNAVLGQNVAGGGSR